MSFMVLICCVLENGLLLFSNLLFVLGPWKWNGGSADSVQNNEVANSWCVSVCAISDMNIQNTSVNGSCDVNRMPSLSLLFLAVYIQ